MVAFTAPIKISIVVPMFNEEANIGPLFARLFPVLQSLQEPFQVIAIDDGSKDRTLLLLQEESRRHPELVVLQLARNFGQHAAIIAGFTASRGDWVITLDADLQNPPEEIPRLVEQFRKGHDLIGTYREGRQDTLFRKLASGLVNRLVRRISKIHLRDFGCMLRGYSRSVADAIAQRREGKTFIPALATLYAANPVEISVRHQARAAGTSKYSLFKLLGLSLDLVTGFSLLPLRALFICGLGVSFLGFLLGGGILIGRVVYGADWAAEGVFTLFAILFIFIGAQFIALGLLGEYIGRIFQEIQERPPFILHQGGSWIPLEQKPAAPIDGLQRGLPDAGRAEAGPVAESRDSR